VLMIPQMMNTVLGVGKSPLPPSPLLRSSDTLLAQEVEGGKIGAFNAPSVYGVKRRRQ
jgi:hypothetical protein